MSWKEKSEPIPDKENNYFTIITKPRKCQSCIHLNISQKNSLTEEYILQYQEFSLHLDLKHGFVYTEIE